MTMCWKSVAAGADLPNLPLARSAARSPNAASGPLSRATPTAGPGRTLADAQGGAGAAPAGLHPAPGADQGGGGTPAAGSRASESESDAEWGDADASDEGDRGPEEPSDDGAPDQ